MKVSSYIVETLKKEKVPIVFGYQGGAITKIVDAIGRDEEVRFMANYHEQAAAFAAEGYARVSGNIGVAIATSGPGAANLITGIGSSYFDSIPCIYITGQVNTKEYKKSNEVRQVGFQETDIVSIVKPITKFAVMIRRADQIRWYLEKAIYLSKAQRPGPVLLDIPMDIQSQEVQPDKLVSYFNSQEYGRRKKRGITNKIVEQVISLIKQAQRPVLLVGGGIRCAKAVDELRVFTKLMPIPVVSTLMGLDTMNHKEEGYVGFIGAYGNRYANLTVANADLILVLGARLTSRQTSTYVDSFARAATIIHVDIDEHELGRVFKKSIQIKSDLKLFLQALIEEANRSLQYKEKKEWLIQIQQYKTQYGIDAPMEGGKPNKFVACLSELLPEKATICTDVGQNQIWAAQSMILGGEQRFITSGGMGAMGFALPSAIGAYFADNHQVVCAIAGDGGFQMNIQELQTIVREQIPIKIFIMNNECLGMIRQFQDMYFESRYEGTVDGYLAPDFIKIGQAYGITSMKINSIEEMKKIRPYLMDQKPYVFEVSLGKETYVRPKLGMGRPIEDQEPLVSREELRKNMLIPLWEEQKAKK